MFSLKPQPFQDIGTGERKSRADDPKHTQHRSLKLFGLFVFDRVTPDESFCGYFHKRMAQERWELSSISARQPVVLLDAGVPGSLNINSTSLPTGRCRSLTVPGSALRDTWLIHTGRMLLRTQSLQVRPHLSN